MSARLLRRLKPPRNDNAAGYSRGGDRNDPSCLGASKENE
jgi:hypothetical protein